MLSEKFFDTGKVVLEYGEGPENGPPLVFLVGARAQYGSIIMIWERFLPIIEVWRETAGSHLYEDPEFLYNEMVRMRTERGHPESIAESRKLFNQ